jgi:hypothetical protein
MAPTTVKTKKRPAATQGGPKTKKTIVEKGSQPQAATEAARKQRSQPVTKPLSKQSNGDDDESSWEEGDAEAEEEAVELGNGSLTKDPQGCSCLQVSPRVPNNKSDLFSFKRVAPCTEGAASPTARCQAPCNSPRRCKARMGISP